METRSHSRSSRSSSEDSGIGVMPLMQRDMQEFSRDLYSGDWIPPQAIERGPRPPDEGKRLNVCVVGGGMAGLRCAEVLIGAGVDVTLLEARGELGGRIRLAQLGDVQVDLGPNWIHGTEDNPIVELARDTGTALSKTDERTLVFDHDGARVPLEQAERCTALLWEIIDDAFRHSNVEGDVIHAKDSLRDFVVQWLRDGDVSEQDRALVIRMAEIWGSFIGSSWETQSLRNFWLEECLDGDNLFVASTHKAILDRMTVPVLEHAAVRLNTIVTAIECGDQSHEVANGRSTRIKAADGWTKTFDDMVLTIPLGCLKEDHVAFEPPLPNPVREALDVMTYGRLEKVFFNFPAAFWDGSTGHGDTEAYSSDTWQAHLASFAHFLRPQYDPANTENGSIEVQSLSNPELFGDLARPTLVFTLYGSFGNGIITELSKYDPSSVEYLDRASTMLHPYYSLLPGYDSDASVCQPTAVLATSWQSDRFAGHGSYTNFTVPTAKTTQSGKRPALERVDSMMEGTSEVEPELAVHLKNLRYGMPDRGVWLAGEHVAPFVGLGTLTGAYWSGEATASRLLISRGFEKASAGA